MSIRKRLAILIALFSLAVLINILALVYLASSISSSLRVIENVRERQLITLQMNAHLRDAEAALYRYQIEGEEGFATQFATQMNNFAGDIVLYDTFATDSRSEAWATTLEQYRLQAVSTGNQLLALKDQQTVNLQTVLTAQGDLSNLLLGTVRPARPGDFVYQTIIDGMQEASREMLTAVTSYLASPQEANRIQFTEAAVGFREKFSLLKTLASTPDETEWNTQIDLLFQTLEGLGSQLISERDNQQSLFAQFFSLIFSAGQQTIVAQIQPYEVEQLAQAQQSVQRVVATTIAVTLVPPGLMTLLAGWIVYRLARQMNTSVNTLLRGATRVARGDFAEPVMLNGKDELSQLSLAFNHMMADLASREKHLRALIGTMAQIQDEERRLIGLDLHDGLTQIVISANMHLNSLNALIGAKMDLPATQELDLSRTLVRQAIDEARRVISELRPTMVEDYGLEEGLRRYVIEVCEAERWEYELAVQTNGLVISSAVGAAIFRIAQEALTNIRKYAQTSKVCVWLGVDDDHLRLTLQDWGQGFELPSTGDSSMHLGLVSMQERAEMFGGQFRIHSERNKGTTVEVKIPLAALAERSKHAAE